MLCAAPTKNPGFVLEQTQFGGAPVEKALLDQAKRQGTTTFWIVLKDQADLKAGLRLNDWKARGEFVHRTLTAVAERSQQPLRRLLQQARVPHQAFWIINAISVTGDQALIDELAARPEVLEIRADRIYRVPDAPLVILPPATNGVQWNIDRINAPTVWNNYQARGEGVVVCNLDTGVQFNHPALVNKYRGNLGGVFDHNYNWYDPAGGRVPYDDNGHGTHTMGTMVGDDGQGRAIGVAPGARWIAAKACATSSCSSASLLASAQWILAPTDLNGLNPDPSRRPNIVNNSWGGDMPGDPWFQAVVRQWIAAGIFPVFSAGNFGDYCWTVCSPADYPEAYSVGAFDSDNHLAYFSAAGPSIFGVGKPELSAPGVNILSSLPGDAYGIGSGTSMAAPHVAGSVALLWSAAPTLKGDIAATRALLEQSGIPVADIRCGGFSTNNNMWGAGRLDISLGVSQAPRGPVGVLQGGITNAVSGLPVSGALVEAAGPMTASTTTDTNGLYGFSALVAGTYSVQASAYGYLSHVEGSVPVIAATVTTQNFSLQLAPATHSVSGLVTSETGQPLAGASVQILNSTNAVLTAANGTFTFTGIPEGSYDIQADANDCLVPAVQSIVVAGDVVGLNFALAHRHDAFGHQCDVITPAYVEATSPLNLHGDDFYLSVPLPFPFVFYGRTYTNSFVSCNGFLTFLEQGASDYLNTAVPTVYPPNAAIYGFWDDLWISPTNYIYTSVSGIAPNRRFVVEWRNAYVRSTGGVAPDFEIILQENGGIQVQYRNVASDFMVRGGGATLGIEEEGGMDGFNFSSDQPSLSPPSFAMSYTHPPTAYVQGLVRNANDGSVVPRAKVSISRAGTLRELTADEGGFYKAQVVLGNITLTASAHNYTPASADLNLVSAQAKYVQDFSLATASGVVLPGSIQFAMGVGQTRTLTFEITNTGTAQLNWSLGQTGPNKIAGLKPTAPVFNPWADPNAPDTRGLYLSTSEDYPPALPGDVLKSWPPSGATLGWGLGRVTNLWVSDVFANTNAARPDLREFTEDGSTTGASWKTITNGAWAADMAYDSQHHLLCYVNVGGTDAWSNSISCMDPTTGQVVNQITGSWTAVPQRGLAYRPDDDTFYIGGWNEAVPNTGITYIYHIKGLSWDTPGAVLDQFSPFEPATAGLAWNPIHKVLWQAVNSWKDYIYALNPTNGDVLLTLARPNPGFNGSGLETDEQGNLWVMSQKPNLVYLLDTGINTFTNAPWLSTSTTNGTIAPGASQTISITTDSSALSLGSYASDLFFQFNDGPGEMLRVPVTVNTVAGTPLLTSLTLPNQTSSNIQSWFGMMFTVNTNPITVTALGRMKLPGNNQVHTLKLVDYGIGQDVPGGSVDVDMSTGTAGQFVYAPLPSPVVLQPGRIYFLVSREDTPDTFYGNASGGKASVTASSVVVPGSISSVSQSFGSWAWMFFGDTGHSFGPLDLKNLTERVLTVTAENAGSSLPVGIVPADIIDQAQGTATFSRVYDDGTEVTLSAAKTAGYNVFQKWQKNGVDFAPARAATVLMNTSAVMNAQYGPPVLAGAVSVNGSNALQAVSVQITGDTNLTLLSDSTGNFSAALFAGGTFLVAPSKASDTPYDNGVDVADVIRVRRHIVGLTPLPSADSLLAADVDGSGTIDLADVILIQRFIVGLNTVFPAGLWRFVPADYVFPEPSAPWNAPRSLAYTNVDANLSGQSFRALKLGDVDGSWVKRSAALANAGNAPADAAGVAFRTTSRMVSSGDVVSLPVECDEFDRLSGGQFTLAWDPRVLRYLNIDYFGLSPQASIAVGTQSVADGKLAVVWDSPTTGALKEGKTLLRVLFEVIGAPGTACEFGFSQAPARCLAAVENETETVPVALAVGTISVVKSVPALSCALDPRRQFVVISTPTEDGIHYTLETSDLLSNPQWKMLVSFVGDGSIKTFSDFAVTNNQRFFRLRRE